MKVANLYMWLVWTKPLEGEDQCHKINRSSGSSAEKRKTEDFIESTTDIANKI